MVNFIKSIYLSALLRMKSNTEVRLDLGINNSPCFTSIYEYQDKLDIPISKENIVTAEKNIQERNIENKTVKNIKKRAEKPTKVVFYDAHKSRDTVFNANTLHCFEYSNNSEFKKIINQHREILFDPMICTILVDRSSFLFLKRCLFDKNAPLTLKISNIGPYWIQVLLPVILFAAAGSIYIAGRFIIKKLSKLDPVFADFNISSSNVIKFKDIIDKSMSQCTICFEDFVNDDDVRVLGCLHYYHPACIDRWLIGHSRKCPCCRHAIEVNERS